MGKKAYVGVSNKARTVKNIYVGVGNKARKVVKGYVGVNGKARQFWPARNPWDPYTGKRLVFDYNYEAGHTYTRQRADILETVRFFIEKTIQYNRGVFDTAMDLLESKTDEIINYVSSQLVASDNTVEVRMNLTTTFNPITIWCYIGASTKNTIQVNTVYNGNCYANIYHNLRNSQDVVDEGSYRIITEAKLYPNGNLNKQTYQNTGNLGMILGNDVDDTFYTSAGIVYLDNLTNVGVHFESFNTGDVVANWDFRQSLYDTVERIVGCRDLMWGNSSIDDSGLHLSLGDEIEVPSWLIRYANTVELTIGSYDINQEYGNGTMFWLNRNRVLLSYYESDGYWSFQDAGRSPVLKESTGITDVNYFQNSTLKIHYDEQGFITLYKNGSRLYKTQQVIMTDAAKCGEPTRLLINITGTVTKLRFFNE